MFLLAVILGFIPLLMIAFHRGRRSSDVTAFIPYIWLITISNVYEVVATTWMRLPTDIWFRIYGLLDFLAMMWFFFKVIRPGAPRLIGFLTTCFLALFFVLIFFWGDVGSLKGDSYLIAYQTIALYILSILWFKNIFSSLEVQSLWKCPTFYFISAFIMYFSGTLFMFLLGEHIVRDDSFKWMWKLNYGLTILFRTLIIIGIWTGLRKSPQYSG